MISLRQALKERPTLVVILAVFLGLIILSGFSSLAVLVIRGQLKANQKLKELEHEFAVIEVPLGDIKTRYASSHKTTLGGVSADYKSDKSYAELRAHYDNELKKRGWIFVAEKVVRIWGHDYGGK